MAVMLKLIPPWARWLGALGLLLGAFFAGMSVNDWRRDSQLVSEIKSARAAERARWKTTADNANAAQADAERRSAEIETELSQYRRAVDLLQEAVARAPLIDYREVPVREGETAVRVPVRGARYRLCFNAAVTGSDADRAACDAAGVPDPRAAGAVPAPDVVRLGTP